MTFTVELASSPDRDHLVAEIWWDDRMVAEVRKSPDGNRYVDLYPAPAHGLWSFRLEEWLEALNVANGRLPVDST